MVKVKKITKKKLKEPDEFITLTERVIHFASVHGKSIVAGGLFVLVLVLAAVSFQMGERRKEGEAARAYGAASEMYERVVGQSREGTTQDDKEVLEKFNEVITKFPRTSFGKLSLIYQGNIHLRQGAYEEAIKAYSTFLEKSGKEKLYRYFGWEGLGHAYEGKKDYGKALEAYQKILEFGEGYQLAEARINMGYCYEKLGKGKEAHESFTSFLSNSPNSEIANAIRRKVSLTDKQ